MQLQKIFSDYYDNERLYSVLMDEYELALFSEAKEAEEEGSGLGSAAIGAGIGAAGAGATIGAAYGARKLARNLKAARLKNLREVRKNIGPAIGKLLEDPENYSIKERKDAVKNAEKYLKKGRKNMEAGFAERNLDKLQGSKTMQWIRNNPGKASAIAAGVAALGAGAGYGVSKLKNRKRNED